MSLGGNDEGKSEFTILGWTALGKEVLNMTENKGIENGSDISNSDNIEDGAESLDSKADTESESDILAQQGLGMFGMVVEGDDLDGGTTEISQDSVLSDQKDDVKDAKIEFPPSIQDSGYGAGYVEENMILLKDEVKTDERSDGEVLASNVRMDDSADSVNETEASGYGETSGTDSSSNFQDSDFSDLSRKRKRGHKSSGKLDSLVKRIMKRSTDLPKQKAADKSQTSTTNNSASQSPTEENSQSSLPAKTEDEAARLFQIQAFADGQMSCDNEESEDENDMYEDCFVSHLRVMDGGMSSGSEEFKKTDKDEDYVPTEGTDEAEEEEPEEYKSDTTSNYSDDEYTKAEKRKKKKKVKAKPFLCGVCNKDFTNAKMLQGHMKCHIDPKSLTCQVCGKLFDFPYKLKNHAKIHNKTFECDICERKFSDRGGFTRHWNAHTAYEKHSCLKCGILFNSSEALEKHQIIHAAPVEKLKCHICSNEFSSKSALGEHLKSHAAILYECDMCDKTFTEDEEYTAHLRAHDEEDDDMFKCKTCGEVLSSQIELDLHDKQQHAKHVYICDTCNKTFTDDHMYSTHLKTHKYEDIVTWKCNKCKLEFAMKNELRDHLKKHVVHSYKCEQCGKTFTDDILYAAHLRSHKTQEEIRWKCNKCKLEFLKKEELKEHLKIHIKHTFICNTCGESFAYESDYNAHLKKHYSDELLECNLCKEKFITNVALTQHLKTHVVGVLVCETCGETFKDKFKFTKHVRFHKAMLRCKKCGHSCSSKVDLNSHMQTHIQHIYVCETCGETYNTDAAYTQHLKSHNPQPVMVEEETQDDLPVIVIS